MFKYLFLLVLYSALQSSSSSVEDSVSDNEFGGKLISSLRTDANLDLPLDEDYEDLRAELLAYHTALASMPTRRSLITTPCWTIGGICINYNLCPGNRYLTEVPGCKNRLKVCCFLWNRHEVRDMKDKGIGNPGYPWSVTYELGGEGVKIKDFPTASTKKSKKKNKNTELSMASSNNTKPEVDPGKAIRPFALLLRDNKVVIV